MIEICDIFIEITDTMASISHIYIYIYIILYGYELDSLKPYLQMHTANEY